MSDEPKRADAEWAFEAPNKMGGNAKEDVNRRVERRLDVYAKADELKTQLAEFKAEDKADGYTEAAIADAVKLRRADPEKVFRTLTIEAEKRVYREAAGVETNLEAAARLAAAHAKTLPEPAEKQQRGKRRRDMN